MQIHSLSLFYSSSCFIRLVSFLSFISLMQLKTGDWKYYMEERPSILRLFNLFGFGITANLSWLMRVLPRANARVDFTFRAKRSDVLPTQESDSRKWSRLRFVTLLHSILFREFFAFSWITFRFLSIVLFQDVVCTKNNENKTAICTECDYPIFAPM